MSNAGITLDKGATEALRSLPEKARLAQREINRAKAAGLDVSGLQTTLEKLTQLGNSLERTYGTDITKPQGEL